MFNYEKPTVQEAPMTESMRNFRLMQKTYISEISQEEAGGMTDVGHRAGQTYIHWQSECEEQPTRATFHRLGVALPADENEERGGEPGNPSEGDTEYSYQLEELVDGRWVSRNF